MKYEFYKKLTDRQLQYYNEYLKGTFSVKLYIYSFIMLSFITMGYVVSVALISTREGLSNYVVLMLMEFVPRMVSATIYGLFLGLIIDLVCCAIMLSRRRKFIKEVEKGWKSKK